MAGILKKNELVIIIPAVNCLKYTTWLISSIKTIFPYKLILINNASTDGIKDYFDNLIKTKNALAFHFKENLGVACSWNFGIKEAIEKFNSKYFLVLNNDIILHPKAIDVLVKTLVNPSVDLVTATDISGKVVSSGDITTYKLPKKEKLVEAPEFSCFMVKKQTIQKVGFFDEDFFPAYFEDNDYHYRMKLVNLKAVKINMALYFHYGSRTITENLEIREKSNLGYIPNRDYYRRKWGGVPGNEIYKIPFGGRF